MKRKKPAKNTPPRPAEPMSGEGIMFKLMLIQGCDCFFLYRRKDDERTLILCSDCGRFHEPRRASDE